MTNGTHDAAVQLLTDHQRFVRLVVQREIKGPLEPPQSPHSPSYLKGLSPSGYMANRPGYKRPIAGITGDSPVTETHSSILDNSKYIINTSPVVPQQTHKYASNQQSPTTPNNGTALGGQIPKTNGINAPQPVPAPRRLTSQSSIGSGVNGQASSHNGNRSEDEDVQVNISSISHFHIIYLKMQLIRKRAGKEM